MALVSRVSRASPLPRTCIALTKSEEKERLLAVYEEHESESELQRLKRLKKSSILF